jgi:hypothetical protein
MVTGTKLTEKGSSTVRKLSGREAAALQRRGPSSPAAGGVEGRMCGEVPMGDSGGTGGAHQGEWVGGDAAARNLAARGISYGPDWTEGRGEKGGCSRGRGEKKWGEKGGEGRSGAAVLCRCTEVGRTIDGVVPHSRRGSRERERRGVPPRPAGGALLVAARGRRARVVWRGHASRPVRAGEGEGG